MIPKLICWLVRTEKALLSSLAVSHLCGCLSRNLIPGKARMSSFSEGRWDGHQCFWRSCSTLTFKHQTSNTIHFFFNHNFNTNTNTNTQTSRCLRQFPPPPPSLSRPSSRLHWVRFGTTSSLRASRTGGLPLTRAKSYGESFCLCVICADYSPVTG